MDAINDKNVLPFRIDYCNTISARENIKEQKVQAINTHRALLDPNRIGRVVSYIIEHFDQKTARDSRYQHSGKRVIGFNSIFAVVQSIDAAKHYYEEFKKQQADTPKARRLKVGLIYSFAAKEDLPSGLLQDEGFETNQLDKSSRDFLERAIGDFNELFETVFSTENFENYYKNISDRLKNRDLDLVIMGNMFLTVVLMQPL